MSLNSDVFPKTLTIGTFDGVHVGHQKILERVKTIAKKEKLIPSVLTFFPHPRMVLNQDETIKLLTTIRERKFLLEKFGIKLICVKTFTKAFSNLSAKAYVEDILVEELNAKHIVIGYDHQFGKNRSANIEDLISFSKEFNFKIEEIPAKDIAEVTVSSTKIRKALMNGKIMLANEYLNYNYFLTGKVVKGQRLGRTIQFPTANIYIEEDYKLIPKDGVYIVQSNISGKLYYGMMNIGHNPTVKNKSRSIEVHFFDFTDDIYGNEIVIEMLKRIRDEKEFTSIDALKTQLQKDKSFSLDYIKSLNEQFSL